MPTDWKYADVYRRGVYRVMDDASIEMAEPAELPQGTTILEPDIDYASEKAAVLAEFRSLRDTALARLNGIQMDATVQSDIDAIKVAKQGLKDLPSNPAVVSAVTGDQTEDALQAIYYGIAAQLAVSSPYAYTAFSNLDV